MKINLSKKSYVISAGADGLGFAIANKIISSGGTSKKIKRLGYKCEEVSEFTN